ncbi:MAG: hypothetical protein JW791_03575 [Nanoarchaeota archaeon]|nr:hypothetical protein [Nanoarchaeota archaeon]
MIIGARMVLAEAVPSKVLVNDSTASIDDVVFDKLKQKVEVEEFKFEGRSYVIERKAAVIKPLDKRVAWHLIYLNRVKRSDLIYYSENDDSLFYSHHTISISLNLSESLGVKEGDNIIVRTF